LIKKELVEELRGRNQRIDNILTGGDDPKKGLIYRMDKTEEFIESFHIQKQNRDKQIAGVITIALTAFATVVGDVVVKMWHKH